MFATLNELLPDSGCRTRDQALEYLKFDGYLQLGRKKVWVEGVSFSVFSVQGYDADVESVEDNIFIQSHYAASRGVWYRLASPDSSYKTMSDDYLWVADLCKHVICYFEHKKDVCLRDFREDFYNWMCLTYPSSELVTQWLGHYGKRDFRSAVVAHIEYNASQSLDDAVDVAGTKGRLLIWKECFPDPGILGSLKWHDSPKDEPIVVTPYVYDCFKDIYFGDKLRSRSPTGIDHKRYKSKWEQRLSWDARQQHAQAVSSRCIRAGTVVGIAADKEGIWEKASPVWYAYVLSTTKEVSDVGRRLRLHVLWLYRPCETVCGTMLYPYPNELFLSEHCNCSCSRADAVYADEVVEVPSVAFFSQPIPAEMGYFVRQTYVTEENFKSFITLNKSHLECFHQTGKRTRTVFPAGSTVLARLPGSDLLEPVIVQKFPDERSAVVRRLTRRSKLCDSSHPNELLYTDDLLKIRRRDLVRRCHVRHYTHEEVITEHVPAPYCYGGTGDCFVMTSKCHNRVEVALDQADLTSFDHGFDPLSLPPGVRRLRALDLFCGGGNLGRGIEDGGAGEVRFCNDNWGPAIHTKYANGSQPSESFFWGSAVRYMQLAMAGKYSAAIALIGAVDMIIAGSPCQGFTTKQQHKTCDQSKSNAALVALVVAFIDLYRPEYAFLENVYGMAVTKFGEKKDQYVFTQVLAALTGMGYQVQFFHANAVNFGSAQSLGRIIISIAAPGLTPLKPPQPSHMSSSSRVQRNLGTLINGEKFGSNEVLEAPFPFVSAASACRGLPKLRGEALGDCITHPDHRLSVSFNAGWRKMMKIIPRLPRGSGFGQALRLGLLPKELLDEAIGRSKPGVDYENFERTFRRFNPTLPFDTITTKCDPRDNRGGGKAVHWDEDRPLTIAEARRAQSIPDHEVLIGSAAEKWKIVGNGVDRRVAAALGVALREAWIDSCSRLGSTGVLACNARAASTAFDLIGMREAEHGDRSLSKSFTVDLSRARFLRHGRVIGSIGSENPDTAYDTDELSAAIRQDHGSRGQGAQKPPSFTMSHNGVSSFRTIVVDSDSEDELGTSRDDINESDVIYLASEAEEPQQPRQGSLPQTITSTVSPKANNQEAGLAKIGQQLKRFLYEDTTASSSASNATKPGLMSRFDSVRQKLPSSTRKPSWLDTVVNESQSRAYTSGILQAEGSEDYGQDELGT